MKRFITFMLTMVMVLSLCACGDGAKTYYAEEERLMANGERLKVGDTIDRDDASITIDGNSIEFVYFGKTYTGVIDKGSIEWNNDPVTFADGTLILSVLGTCADKSGYDLILGYFCVTSQVTHIITFKK